VCSAGADRSDDLTAKARIRDAAIHLFASRGFKVPLRAIATAAGCSPALIVHHFGSKERLRQTCDDHITRIMADGKRQILVEAEAPSAADMTAILANLWTYDDVPGYLVRSIQAGGSLARQTLQSLVDLTKEIIAAGAREGRMRLGSDPDGQALYVALSSIGTLIAYCALTGNDLTTREQVARYVEDLTAASLEAHTHPLLTGDDLLIAYSRALSGEQEES
jgi:AcrR family transcriptional regulator